MKYYKIVQLKQCKECFTFYNNMREKSEISRTYDIFNKGVIEDESKREFNIDIIKDIGMAPKCFYGFNAQIDRLGQHEIISVGNGSADIFIINIDPESEDFGAYQKVMIWKGTGIYIAPLHLFGICSTKKGFIGKLIFGSGFREDHYYNIDPFDIQDNNEKFDYYDFSGIDLIKRGNKIESIDRKEILRLLQK